MADINTNTPERSSKVRSKKTSTRIDMTPMVDLGFLLLTFFILTAVISKPFIMNIMLPEDSVVDQPPINARHVLSIVLEGNDKIYWHLASETKLNLTGFSKDGIRKVLRENKALIKNMYVLIKPSDHSHYKNLVDMLDELTINEIGHYAIVDLSREDTALLKDIGL